MVDSVIFQRQEAREQREAELRARRAEFSAECKVRGGPMEQENWDLDKKIWY